MIIHESSIILIAVQLSPPTQSYGAAVVFVTRAAPDQLGKDFWIVASGVRKDRIHHKNWTQNIIKRK